MHSHSTVYEWFLGPVGEELQELSDSLSIVLQDPNSWELSTL